MAFAANDGLSEMRVKWFRGQRSLPWIPETYQWVNKRQKYTPCMRNHEAISMSVRIIHHEKPRLQRRETRSSPGQTGTRMRNAEAHLQSWI